MLKLCYICSYRIIFSEFVCASIPSLKTFGARIGVIVATFSRYRKVSRFLDNVTVDYEGLHYLLRSNAVLPGCLSYILLRFTVYLLV